MADEISKPHDHLFRSVFGEEQESEAARLLQAYLPQAVSRELLWSSLKWQSATFIDDRLRDSESDLLYAVRRKADGAPAWLYVLLEHQSTPDRWLRLRLLAELAEAGENEDLERIVVYIATTTRQPERWHRFADAVRRQVPGGGDLTNKTQTMLQIYGEVVEQEARQEGRQEGELRGKVLTIEGLLDHGVPWSTIEAATGTDEAAFRRFKHQLDAADHGANPD